mmetsp:Transcript_6490/g.9411  ORF Transcript_6490/g.9411 Transcript_6490/m.9411 type:complete len:175 (-) Transcript_6490:328-852(-)
MKKQKRTLSGSTMGMKFMRRKEEAKTVPELRKKNEDKLQANPSIIPPSDAINNRQLNHELCVTSASITDPNSIKTNENLPLSLVTKANEGDMHGIGAEIIGRRSFNGFHKIVGETWKTAMNSYQERTGAKSQRENISDEELLRRYKKYINGNTELFGDRNTSKRSRDKRKCSDS